MRNSNAFLDGASKALNFNATCKRRRIEKQNLITALPNRTVAHKSSDLFRPEITAHYNIIVKNPDGKEIVIPAKVQSNPSGRAIAIIGSNMKRITYNLAKTKEGTLLSRIPIKKGQVIERVESSSRRNTKQRGNI